MADKTVEELNSGTRKRKSGQNSRTRKSYIDKDPLGLEFRIPCRHKEGNNTQSEIVQQLESNIEQMVTKKQIDQLYLELQEKNKKIESLECINAELQELQVKHIDETLTSTTIQEVNLMKEQLQKISDDNQLLREQYQHTNSQLQIALFKLRDSELRQLSNDMEINMLQHQVLDLQSASDSKAIIARLSNEILVAHLQASESHKRIDDLHAALNKERELRMEAEDMFRARQKIFDVYALRYESKFRYMYEIMLTLRQQYQGSLPLISVENYLNKIEELSRKNKAAEAKLNEIEDLRANLLSKHSVFDQILHVSKDKCFLDEDSCPHKLNYLMAEALNSQELDYKINKKLKAMESSHEDLIKHCNSLEKTLILVNQGFETIAKNGQHKKNGKEINGQSIELELEDIQSDDDSSPRRSLTVTLTKPVILKPQSINTTLPNENEEKEYPIKSFQRKHTAELSDAHTQTVSIEISKSNKLMQTDENSDPTDKFLLLKTEVDQKSNQLQEAMTLAGKRTKELLNLNNEKAALETMLQNLKASNTQQDIVNEKLRFTVDDLTKRLNDFQMKQITETNQRRENINEENKSLLLALKESENDKNAITAQYKELLSNERDEYAKSVNELQVKIMELQSKLDRRASESSISNGEAVKEVASKYCIQIAGLEDKCFKLQSELDECKSELTAYQTESVRWKNLAAERLAKMEQLNSQVEERHCHEVKSYKDENEHWLLQLNEMQREHMDLRTKLTEQKTVYLKQLSDKDAQIEQLRHIINNLRTQIMNMQTLISVNDPSFDLSAIVEVEESDSLSHNESDRLELKFESMVDLHDSHDHVARLPASSTSIWQEPLIERLRREKQLASKQNAILRRQIKVLASRERRSRLDAQNLKNQIFRISTTGNKVTTAETAALLNKIASLQAQLTSARRDTNSSLALWDKWKRAQKSAERWQARYEEKCQDVIKLESSLSLAKSAVSRLEKEKRVLLTRLNEAKNDDQLIAIEKHDAESQEKPDHTKDCLCTGAAALPVSSQALLDRVEAQQRRIAALEIAEKGNEFLVSEYERSLAEITSLKGQVLKLESTLLEAQIRTPIKSAGDAQPELDYWKSYCEMMKEENVQLTQKINFIETLPTTVSSHRVNDLEQTVLVLRGVINKLKAEQKSGVVHKKIDSRPNSSRSSHSSNTEKVRIQSESHRTEVANLKRTIHDKDLLLERSKEMLKIAAEREDELLRENAYLHRQLKEITRPHGGFMSA